MAMSIWQYLELGSSRLNQRMGCFWRKGRRALDWRIMKGWMLTIVAVKRGTTATRCWSVNQQHARHTIRLGHEQGREDVGARDVDTERCPKMSSKKNTRAAVTASSLQLLKTLMS